MDLNEIYQGHLYLTCLKSRDHMFNILPHLTQTLFLVDIRNFFGGRRGRDRMVVVLPVQLVPITTNIKSSHPFSLWISISSVTVFFVIWELMRCECLMLFLLLFFFVIWELMRCECLMLFFFVIWELMRCECLKLLLLFELFTSMVY